ncbi:XdhC family protein [Pseudochrobactrum saccharolyticum]|uniref:Xanthine dehydrogenase accessory factor n=1 Tax=Pseudochrobactrum saccharolyticum TaxID=354352 RepID=A0A7W8AGP0_9HYPH|nr:XdhC family protein [Pseudochrobactrum saccharolyticum]KAB0540558.1 XdhC family protein [Pseudochrobactrum saccharolyticum]MBB5090112.1 xanthine dehydrogenase accessory factor [Pseudochrobactrum saccharolyticum]MDP8252015.1 XdhC family protein [Pseudochrobactrum saccharolyticum]
MEKRNTNPLHIAQNWFEQGRKLALVTVLSVWGSAPRPAGSHLICDDQGNFEGSVSGGCIEAEVIAQALDVLVTGQARDLSFGISDETAWSAGLSCGGTIRLLIAPYDAAMHDVVTQIVQAQTKRQCITSRTELATGQITLIPAPDNAKITQLDETGFIQTYRPQPHIVVTGAVHIAQALAQMAQITGYGLSIIDPRSGFATAERFPSVQLHETWPEEFFKTNQPDSFTALVALSHIPHLDDPALTAALKSDCFYIGALGSRKTHAKRLERLTAAGFEATNLERIHAPIGLAISAQEPAEIAVAILAEIIQAYRKA